MRTVLQQSVAHLSNQYIAKSGGPVVLGQTTYLLFMSQVVVQTMQAGPGGPGQDSCGLVIQARPRQNYTPSRPFRAAVVAGLACPLRRLSSPRTCDLSLHNRGLFCIAPHTSSRHQTQWQLPYSTASTSIIETYGRSQRHHERYLRVSRGILSLPETSCRWEYPGAYYLFLRHLAGVIWQHPYY